MRGEERAWDTHAPAKSQPLTIRISPRMHDRTMALPTECRLCLKKYHSVSIFSPTSIKQMLPDTPDYIFDQKFDPNDGRFKFFCRNCVSSAKAIQFKDQLTYINVWTNGYRAKG